ncbi:uncharacterized protein LOC100142306 [Tribolium castaneum]|uniref:Odorant binding protein 3 n=1 Tax=Tribolium castaneum TaxID=7070 RepID=D2A674_TRICA|nr:PREDICTED: uncharacterized protein LOC100142306 [Tribolium castaneum]EFA05675.1 odorant binding protein 3 [Tribolium castaneum]|eukprot:XP_001813376.1 PREDICTED: uncharacterized protein LOC100142306 [Tribolium castaneum]
MWSFVTLLFSFLVLASAQKKGKYWTTISECLTEHSMGVEDMKKFDLPAEKMSEEMLCFNKCFYDKLLITDENGEINTDNLMSIPLVNAIDASKHDDLVTCLKKVGKIEECDGVKKIEQCFVEFI